MLNALDQQLKVLARNPKDPFTATIRKMTGNRMAPRYEANLRRMILALPSMIRQIRAWVDESDQPWQVKRLQFFGLAYLYNPTDFLPEKTQGFFGYVDDAYIIARIYEITMEEMPHAGLHPLEEGSEIRDNVGEWLKLTQEILPDETNRMDAMLDRYANGKSQSMATW